MLERDEQVAAIGEMWRVLRPGGSALIEGRTFAAATRDEVERGARRGPDDRIDWSQVEGILNPHFVHDASSLARVCADAGVASYEVLEREWGGRQRLVLRLERPRS